MIKLVACDMDGTLLDSQKRLPADFPQVMTALKERGVCFAVASGRQYAALRRDFEAYLEDMMFICENGALVMQRDERLLIDPVDPRELYRIVTAAKGLRGVYPVVCRAEMALIEKTASPEFVRNTCMYYPSVQVVDDLTEYCNLGDVCKVAFYDEYDAQTHELPELQSKLEPELSIILSGEHWVDVMKPGVTKGAQWVRLNKQVELLDTPGILWPKFEDQEVGIKLAMIGSIKEEILNTEELSLELLKLLKSRYSGTINERYDADEALGEVELLGEIAKRRGCLMKGGEPDLTKAAAILLEDFRSGKLGKITLELPEQAQED